MKLTRCESGNNKEDKKMGMFDIRFVELAKEGSQLLEFVDDEALADMGLADYDLTDNVDAISQATVYSFPAHKAWLGNDRANRKYAKQSRKVTWACKAAEADRAVRDMKDGQRAQIDEVLQRCIKDGKTQTFAQRLSETGQAVFDAHIRLKSLKPAQRKCRAEQDKIKALRQEKAQVKEDIETVRNLASESQPRPSRSNDRKRAIASQLAYDIAA